MRVVKGGLNHESREINEVFHDSRKFSEGFTFHVNKISAEWNDYRALGTKCNDRDVIDRLFSQVPKSVASIWMTIV